MTVTLVDWVPFGLAVCCAVTVQVSAVEGAVYRPEVLPIVPQDAVQVTASVAENCTVPPAATVGFKGEMENPVLIPPVPERDTVCGLLVAVSVNVRAAARVPEAEGANTIPTEHVPFGEILVPQVLLEMEKSLEFVPVITMLLMETSVLPPLYKEADCDGLLEPTVTVANESVEGLAVSVLVGDVPVPESVTVWGLLLSESTNVSVAVLLPVAVGAKTTFTVQLADAARLLPQV